jgi:hypothetical protein
MYLVIIYYMLYNVVWNKLRTFYYVRLSQTLNNKKITLNTLYFIINYLHAIVSTKINKNILHVTSLLLLQDKTFGYIHQDTKNKCIEEETFVLPSFYIENTYFTSNAQMYVYIEANQSLKTIY